MVICLERGADCLHVVQLMPLPSQNPPSSLALLKSRLFLPSWYRLTNVVLVQRPLDGCSSSSSSSSNSSSGPVALLLLLLLLLRSGMLVADGAKIHTPV